MRKGPLALCVVVLVALLCVVDVAEARNAVAEKAVRRHKQRQGAQRWGKDSDKDKDKKSVVHDNDSAKLWKDVGVMMKDVEESVKCANELHDFSDEAKFAALIFLQSHLISYVLVFSFSLHLFSL